MQASLSLIIWQINSLWLTGLKRQVWLDSFDRRHQVRPVWFHFLIWPEDISIMGRNPPEESEATNLYWVATPHVQTLQKNHHYQKCWKQIVVGFKSFVSSMCIKFSRKCSHGLVPMNPSTSGEVVLATWVVWMCFSFHFSTVNIQNLNLLTHQLPTSYFWMNVSFLKGGGLNIISYLNLSVQWCCQCLSGRFIAQIRRSGHSTVCQGHIKAPKVYVLFGFDIQTDCVEQTKRVPHELGQTCFVTDKKWVIFEIGGILWLSETYRAHFSYHHHRWNSRIKKAGIPTEETESWQRTRWDDQFNRTFSPKMNELVLSNSLPWNWTRNSLF